MTVLTSTIYISIDGTIGVGKTNLCKFITKKTIDKKILEKFRNNPFLITFYSNITKYAFITQIFFLVSRYRDQKMIRILHQKKNYIIADYYIRKDNVFAKCTMSSKELKTYIPLFYYLYQKITTPLIIIYLKNNIHSLTQKIKQRGRDLETLIKLFYVNKINNTYKIHFLQYIDNPIMKLEHKKIHNYHLKIKNILLTLIIEKIMIIELSLKLMKP